MRKRGRPHPDASGRQLDAAVSPLAGKRCFFVFKRCFDVVFALLVSVLLLFPVLLLTLLIVIKDPGCPFYSQMRVGKDGKTFMLLKFRSMSKHADRLEHALTPEQLNSYRTEYKLEDDPRLIGYRKPGDGKMCFGGMLRRSSADELPQLIWNVLIRGNMSVVGPRPVLQEELDKYYTEQEKKLLLSVKPGLTGYWQAYARNNVHYSTGERQKMELYYVQHLNLWLDIRILAATVGAVLRKSGV